MDNALPLLTRDGRSALANAKRIAKQNHRPLIDSNMLLLGILQLPGSQAESALKALHVNTDHLISRLSASIKLDSRPHEVQPETGVQLGKFNFTADGATLLAEALAEAQLHSVDFIDTRLLLLGMLRCPQCKAGEILTQYGVCLEPFRAVADLKGTPVQNLPRFQKPSVSLGSGVCFGVSIVFIGLVLLTILAGYFTYAGIINAQMMMFIFVIGGWIISVALHEFGHAMVAYWSGDKSVVDKGYLTLNPLKYTNPLLSIALPVLFLVMGGIGLPGGAVYINHMAIRSPIKRSLTSAAGPIASGICALLLVLPFVCRWVSYEMVSLHLEFWAGLAFLAFLQITAIGINILPIPGLDGFGVLYPFLPPEIASTADVIRPFGFMILLGLLFLDTPIRVMFWQEIWSIAYRISPALAQLAGMGLDMFRLW